MRIQNLDQPPENNEHWHGAFVDFFIKSCIGEIGGVIFGLN